MARETSLIGSIGVLSVATRGAAGPGEVMVKIRGRLRGVYRVVAHTAAQGRDGSGYRVPWQQDRGRQRVGRPAGPALGLTRAR